MNKIPTAEEILNDFHFNYKGDGNYVLEAMKEFAKLHYKAQLQAIVKNVRICESEPMFGQVEVFVDKNSIINAYPLTNIK